uniref:Transposase domain-containing protein n=1 Tax=Trichogramma kaykai TaxID=54128 RepID=A0ABD2X762_9HYME
MKTYFDKHILQFCEIFVKYLLGHFNCSLHEAGHDDLHRDIRSIVKTPKKTIITPCSPGEYYHRGLQNALVNILKSRKLPSKIVIDINIDGLPISKSSKRTLWSIQGLIVGELTPFVIGVYHGFKKPSSIEDHLRPFINEYKNLRSEGFNFRENSYKVKLRCVICDSPARSFCSNTKQFNGYFGCSKCVVEGSWRKKVVFLEANLTLRTNESFRNRSQPEHHLGYSPFEELEIDMIFLQSN